MTEIKYTHLNLKNLGVTTSEFPKPLFDEAMKEIREIQRTWPVKDQYNKNLAGNIKREYYSEKIKQIVAPFLESLGKEYREYWDYHPNEDVKLDSTWVNYQKKYETNPVHNHSGILSYVAWMQIPYTLEEEQKQDSVKNARSPYPTYFSFLYSTIASTVVSPCFLVINQYKVLFFSLAILPTHLYPPDIGTISSILSLPNIF